MLSDADRLTIFGSLVVTLLLALAAIVLWRGSRSRKLVGSMVVAAAACAYLFNLVPGLRVAPNERDRTSCAREYGNDGEPCYQWDIVAHKWTCHDHWLAPGFPGV